jgi:glycogen synthase
MADPDVVLVGPYPPPFGGISAHVDRLAQAILERGLSVRIVNHFDGGECDPLVTDVLRRNPWRYWRVLRASKARVVHYHHSRWSTLLAASLALRRGSAATVATVHGRELEPFLGSRTPGIARMTRRALREFDVLIAVSVEVERSLRNIGPPVEVIPAYLPARDRSARLSPDADGFLRGGTSLVMAVYRMSVDSRGRTVYGLETAIAAFAALAPGRPDLRLAIFMASRPGSRRESERLRRLIDAVTDNDLSRRIGVFYGEPLTAAFPLAAVYLRPTLTDGDAVSIREAIAVGVPVLASDVVRRPPGVMSVGPEPAGWRDAILQALARERPSVGSAEADPADALIGIYERLGCAPANVAQAALA